MKQLRWGAICGVLVLAMALTATAEAKGGKGHGQSERTAGQDMPPGLSRKDKMPPGLEKQNKTPAGWDKGKKTGWDKEPKRESWVKRTFRGIFGRKPAKSKEE